ncbi:hypothetical protein C8R44DRAFT_760502 [Mycena epipterygia]|nr:hypothetical protein C8R44DRAFT_760502 [Mycena epipterygia]
MPASRKPPMSLAMPTYNPDLEYSLDLGAEGTPQPEVDENAPALPRTRSWRSSSHDKEKTRSSAYDAAGNLKLAVRGRKEAQRDCGICEEVAVGPVRTECCGALFCRAHIDDVRPLLHNQISTFPSTRSTDATVAVHAHYHQFHAYASILPNLTPAQWIYGPAATGLCPACAAPCVLPPAPDADSKHRPRTPPSSRSQSAERLTGLQSAGASPPTRSVFPVVRVVGVLGLLLGFAVLRRYGERVEEIRE